MKKDWHTDVKTYRETDNTTVNKQQEDFDSQLHSGFLKRTNLTWRLLLKKNKIKTEKVQIF